MRAIVFANGVIEQPERAAALIRPGDLIIAADGGTHHCLALGLTPHLVVGDLDSLTSADLHSLEASGTKLLRYPARKDFTDLELALQHARERGASEALVLGALGARWDMTLANLLLPATLGLAPLRISLVDGAQEILMLRGGEGAPSQIEIRGRAGDTVSLIPLGGDAHGVTTQGLEYPLFGENLIFGATRGISNVLLGEEARVMVQEGLIAVVVIHQ